MEPIEAQEVAALRADIGSLMHAELRSPWSARQAVASQLLARANEAWWRVHRSDPSAYERDLNRLNALTDWHGPHQQLAYWSPRGGTPVLMPPKFFGGDPLALHECFVASMSLNHAVLPPTSKPFAEELAEQQNDADAFTAHSSYFSKPYAYAKFFQPRGEVLHAYANNIGVQPVESRKSWRALNRQFSFYIEAFPTRSVRFARPPLAPARTELESTVFVCAINSVVHDIVLRLLRPTRVLLAGQTSWEMWPDSGADARGEDVGLLVRSNGKCRVFRNRAISAIHGGSMTVVRSNFLRTVYGPNSTAELRLLGHDVLAT
jgi:hypothetical protein